MTSEEAGEKIRLDKWLWHARFFKTRTLAGKICKGGKVRVNGTHAVKAASLIKPGDVLTFAKGEDVKVVKVLAPGERRGPATEAQTLYEDMSPPKPKAEDKKLSGEAPKRETGAGRPTKADRRAIDKLMDR